MAALLGGLAFVAAAALGGRVKFNQRTGGTACGAYRGGPQTLGRAGGDAHGYWPQGGYYGLVVGAYCPPGHGQTWTGNVWDDNGRRVGCR